MKLQTKRAATNIKTSEEKKRTVTVWDKRICDTCYQNHFQNLQNVKKKIDNTPPFVASSNFFKKLKFQNEQRSQEALALANNNIVNRLNLIFRTRGKVDHSNHHAYTNNSKLQEIITKSQYQSKFNKNHLKMLRKTKRKLEMSTLEMNYDWENKQRVNIFQNSVYSIVLNSIRCPEYDVDLIDPPSQKEYKENPKVVLEFQRESQPLGKIVILTFLQNAPLVSSRFLKMCSCHERSYDNCIVYKIISSTMMETGDVENGIHVNCTKFKPEKSVLTHNNKGSVSMIVDTDGTVNSRFSISFKPMPLLNEKRIVFGRVIKGFDVLNSIDSQGTHFGVPQKKVFISKSRVFL